VILKSLEQAQKDNDVIRSVIVASGINQDGRTPGITMPNASAQGTWTPWFSFENLWFKVAQSLLIQSHS
jgi:hypothetical protein